MRARRVRAEGRLFSPARTRIRPSPLPAARSSDGAAESWRRKYYDTVEAIDRAERQLAEMATQLYSSVSRVSLGAHGLDDPLDGCLDRLLDAVRAKRAPQEIADLAFEVQEAGRKREAAEPSEPEAPPSHDLAAALTQVLAELPFDGPLEERARSLRAELAALPPEAALSNVVAITAELRAEIERERGEMRSYLELLDGRLRGLGELLTEQATETLAETRMRKMLGDTIGGEVEGMRRAVADAVEVEPLRQAVAARISAIETGMSEFLAAEAERRARIESTAQRTNERLAQIESESAHLMERLAAVREAATRDALTGCLNRAAFDERIDEELARRTGGAAPLSLLIGDIDWFKRVNDTYGHPAGDKVLRAVAAVLQRGTRSSDFLARYGGEEFVLLLPGTGIDGAMDLAEDLRACIARTRFLHQGRRVRVSMSFGVAEILAGDTPTTLLERADQALYQAKAAGRNRVKAA